MSKLRYITIVRRLKLQRSRWVGGHGTITEIAGCVLGRACEAGRFPSSSMELVFRSLQVLDLSSEGSMYFCIIISLRLLA